LGRRHALGSHFRCKLALTVDSMGRIAGVAPMPLPAAALAVVALLCPVLTTAITYSASRTQAATRSPSPSRTHSKCACTCSALQCCLATVADNSVRQACADADAAAANAAIKRTIVIIATVCGAIIVGTILWVVAVHRRRRAREVQEAAALLSGGSEPQVQGALQAGLPPTPFTAFMMGGEAHGGAGAGARVDRKSGPWQGLSPGTADFYCFCCAARPS
jgi:hypothetical protein